VEVEVGVVEGTDNGEMAGMCEERRGLQRQSNRLDGISLENTLPLEG